MAKQETVLLGLVILLAVVMRVPFFPHESGDDTFIEHLHANSIIENQGAPNLLSIFSFFGLYPFSTSMLNPYLISLCSLMSGLPVESVMYWLPLLLSIFTIIFSYNLSKAFGGGEFQNIVVCIFVAISGYFLRYTFWSMTRRGLFMTYLFFVLWALFFTWRSRSLSRYLVLIVSFATIGMSHLMVAYFFIVYIIPYVVVNLFRLNFENRVLRILIFGFPAIIVVTIPSLTDKINPISSTLWKAEILRDSMFSDFLSFAWNYNSYINLLLILTVVGFIYLLVKKKLSSFESYLLLATTFSWLFFTNMEYGVPVTLAIYALLAGEGFRSLEQVQLPIRRTHIHFLIATLILCSMVVSQYLIIINNKPVSKHEVNDWVNSETIGLGEWFKDNTAGRIVCGGLGYSCFRIGAIFNIPEMKNTDWTIAPQKAIIKDAPVTRLLRRDISSSSMGGLAIDWIEGGMFYLQKHTVRIFTGTEVVSDLIRSEYNVRYFVEDMNGERLKYGTYKSDIGFSTNRSLFLLKTYSSSPRVYDNNLEAVYYLE
jgi:hypothetical protein